MMSKTPSAYRQMFFSHDSVQYNTICPFYQCPIPIFSEGIFVHFSSVSSPLGVGGRVALAGIKIEENKNQILFLS